RLARAERDTRRALSPRRRPGPALGGRRAARRDVRGASVRGARPRPRRARARPRGVRDRGGGGTDVIAIVGPTASGKSSLALGVAERIGAEILSADSRQLYRGMDIGTAKPSAADRARVPHHLIDVADPGEPYTVFRFQNDARAALAAIMDEAASRSSSAARVSTCVRCSMGWRARHRPAVAEHERARLRALGRAPSRRDRSRDRDRANGTRRARVLAASDDLVQARSSDPVVRSDVRGSAEGDPCGGGVIDTETPPERAYLVALDLPSAPFAPAASLEELASLVEAAGGIVTGRVVQNRGTPDRNSWVGKGKAEEIGREVARLRADIVVADDELSPAQQRTLEETTNVPVVDRSGVILDIFARHARSREGRIQVELAQLE